MPGTHHSLDLEDPLTFHAPRHMSHVIFSGLASYLLLGYTVKFFFNCLPLSSRNQEYWVWKQMFDAFASHLGQMVMRNGCNRQSVRKPPKKIGILCPKSIRCRWENCMFNKVSSLLCCRLVQKLEFLILKHSLGLFLNLRRWHWERGRDSKRTNMGEKQRESHGNLPGIGWQCKEYG